MRYLFGLVLLFSLATIGNAQGTRGLYVGGGLGMMSYEDAVDAGSPALSDDRKAYRILGGYRFNDHYGVEAAWGTTADIKHTFSIFALRGIAMMPLSKIGLYAGAGYYEASFNRSIPLQDDFDLPALAGIGSNGSNVERNHSGATVIGGIMLDLRRLSLRAEYEWLDTDDPLEASGINALLLFRF